MTTRPKECALTLCLSLVFVSDPTDGAVIPVGKQALEPSHIFYRPCSGIWQQVWIESVPADHITRLDVAANMDGEGMSEGDM